MGSRMVIGWTDDRNQRCAFCLNRDPAPYLLSHEYIKELQGNPNRMCAHIECIKNRQRGLGRISLVKVKLDDYCRDVRDTDDSDNKIVEEEGSGLPFYWAGKRLYIEPERSAWIEEHTTYPRNILVSHEDDVWWLWLPKNQALMFKMTWAGEIVFV